MGLTVLGLACPDTDDEEEGRPASARRVVHDVGELDLLLVDAHADLFARFPDKGCHDRLTRFEMPGRQGQRMFVALARKPNAASVDATHDRA
jgi:hypothetical protein